MDVPRNNGYLNTTSMSPLLHVDGSLVKSLGIDEKLDEWIESKRKDTIFRSKSLIESKHELLEEKLRLHELQTEISEKFFIALDNIPEHILSKLPGYDIGVHKRLRIFNQFVKAKINQTKRKISNSNGVTTHTGVSNEQIQIFEISDSESSKETQEAMEVSNTFEDMRDARFSNYASSSVTNEMNSRIYSFVNADDGNINIEPTRGKIPLLEKEPTISNSHNIFAAQLSNKSTFHLKKPSKISSQSSSVTRNMIGNNVETKCSISQNVISTSKLKTSTITSAMHSTNNQTFNKKNDKTEMMDDCIINVDLTNFFSSSLFSDSEDDDSAGEHPQNIGKSNNDDFFNQNPNISEIRQGSTNPLRSAKGSANTNGGSEFQLIGNAKNDGVSGKFNNFDFPHCKEMLEIFKTTFGLCQFRPNQLSAVNAVLLGYDCFVLMPTGGGKSLCYQLPALLTRGVTIVISPLRSLIVDQTQKLLSLDIPSTYLTGDLTNNQVSQVYEQLCKNEPKLKLLYITPEKLGTSPKLLSALTALYQRGQLARFVIDEVHCVSQWGHDFRPDYVKLRMLKERFAHVPIVALTATATHRVRQDILHQLNLSSPKWFISSFNRPNLRYTVYQKKPKSSKNQILSLINEMFRDECGIIYCISRNETDEYAMFLSNNGVEALSYHAGLADAVRVERQKQWIAEKVKVICATIAFGMGIDKPNVRFVIHAAMPKSLEGFYQESGRAGRDGESASCILLYSYGDVYRYRRLMESGNAQANPEALQTHLDNLYKMVHFCGNLADCRRALLLNYFGEKFDREECIANSDSTCDNCRTYHQFTKVDVTEDAKALVRLIQSLEKVRQNNVTILQVVDIYKGSDISTIKYKLGCEYRSWFAAGQSMSKNEIERLLHKLIIEGYLEENMQLNNGIICAYVAPGKLANELLVKDNVQIFLQKKKLVTKAASTTTNHQQNTELNAAIKELEQRCYTELLEMVNGIAGALDISVNSVMNIVALRAMSQQLPIDETGMLKIPHVTKANFQKYGKALLDVTQKYATEKMGIMPTSSKTQLPSRLGLVTSHFETFDEGGNSVMRDVSNNGNKRSKSSGGRPYKRFRGNRNYQNNRASTWKKNNGTRKDASASSRKNAFSQATKGNKSSIQGTSSTYKNKNNRVSTGPGLCELTKKSIDGGK